MKEYSGEFLELGPSENVGAGVRYMYLKIGDQVVKDVVVKNSLDAVLRGELTRRGSRTIYIKKILLKNRLIGIAGADGQVYKIGKVGAFSWFFLGLLAAGLGLLASGETGFGWGLLLAWIVLAPFAIPLILGLRVLKTLKADYEI